MTILSKTKNNLFITKEMVTLQKILWLALGSEITIDVPRDREGSFVVVLVEKYC